jgi:monoamine oxidase
MGRIVVIGGGSAGIAAARALHDDGRDVLLLEAGDRLGGRAHTVPLTLSTGQVRVDHGCGWLHSARRNPWTTIAETSGFHIDRSSPGWGEQWRNLGYPPHEQEAFGQAYARFERHARAAVTGPDRPLSELVEPADPFRATLDAMSGYISGAPLDRVSLHDWAAYEADASNDNWAVREGYGSLIASHAAGVPVRLSTPVTRIDHRGLTVRVVTTAGAIEADRVIVAVPTTVLARGEITFDPPLPAKQDAAAALPLGLADKSFLAVDDTPWPPHSHLIGNPHAAVTGSYRLSPFGWPMIEAFYGGLAAEALDEKGAAAAFAIDELVKLLGSDFRRRLHPLGATRWRQQPYIAGSYSYAVPGRADARSVLAETVDGRLFFAGEACHATDFTTAHGAYETGLAAAHAILSAPRAVA